MKISELPKYLSLLPPTQAVLVIGPPGCGKSTAVREFAESEAERLQREFVDYDDDDEVFIRVSRNPEKYYVYLDLRLTETEPTDFLGVPRDVDHFIVYKPLRWVQVFSQKSAAGLIFLDELTNVRREDILAQAYKLVLDRRAGFRRFSDSVRIVAAGNSPEHSSVANLLPAPLTNRFAVMEIDAGDVYEWIDYVNSREGGILESVAGYITRFPGDLTHKTETETLENFPTRRAWSRLNAILRDKQIRSAEEVKEIATQFLGRVVAEKFSAFCRLQKYLPEPEAMIKKPEILDRVLAEAKKDGVNTLDITYYAVASAAGYLSSKNAEVAEATKFAEKLAEIQGDLLVIFIRLLPKSLRQAAVIKLSGTPRIQEIITSIAKYI